MFESARLKVVRANQHISASEAVFQTFINGIPRPYGVFIQGSAGPNYHFGITQPVPKEVMIIAGDAVHNLRSALDHCVWELWIHDVPEIERTAARDKVINFPTGCDALKYKNAIKRVIDAGWGKSDVEDLLIKLADYPEGETDRKALYALHRLDIADKHCILVPTVPSVKISGLIEVTTAHDGSKTTKELSTRKVHLTPDFAWSPVEKNHLFGGLFTGGYSHNPFTPKLVLNEDHKITFEILFAKNNPFPGEPIFQSLRRITHLVSRVIDRFDNLISARRKP